PERSIVSWLPSPVPVTVIMSVVVTAAISVVTASRHGAPSTAIVSTIRETVVDPVGPRVTVTVAEAASNAQAVAAALACWINNTARTAMMDAGTITRRAGK